MRSTRPDSRLNAAVQWNHFLQQIWNQMVPQWLLLEKNKCLLSGATILGSICSSGQINVCHNLMVERVSAAKRSRPNSLPGPYREKATTSFIDFSCFLVWQRRLLMTVISPNAWHRLPPLLSLNEDRCSRKTVSMCDIAAGASSAPFVGNRWCWGECRSTPCLSPAHTLTRKRV